MSESGYVCEIKVDEVMQFAIRFFLLQKMVGFLNYEYCRLSSGALRSAV